MSNNRRFRGIRAPIDSGYILGRTDKGRGDVHPIKLNDLAIALGKQLSNSGGSVDFANPTATASDTAVNGTATTAMRSDAAPAIQKATAAQFGLVKVDGTTITATGGVISSAAGASDQLFTGYPTSTASNVTGDGTIYTIVGLTADQNDNSNMNLTTGTWTAPAAGTVDVTALFLAGSLTSAMTQGYGYVIKNGSVFHYSFFGNVANLRDSANNVALSLATSFPVAAGDTLTFAFRFSNGTKVASLYGGVSQTYLSIRFVPAGSGGGGGSSQIVFAPQLTSLTLTDAQNFGSRGTSFTPTQNLSCIGVSFGLNFVASGTYKVGIAPFNTTTKQMTSAPTYTGNFVPAASQVYQPALFFGAPVTLTKGTTYLIFVVRTDVVGTTSMSMIYSGSPIISPGIYFPTATGAWKVASNGPLTTDTWTSGADLYNIMPIYTITGTP